MALNSVVRSAAPLLGVSTAQALPLVLSVLRRGYATAGEKLIAQMKRDGVGLPWERKSSPEGAVEKLRSFLGLPSGVGPGDVLDLSIDQLEGVLKATSGKMKDKELEDALFVHADGVTTRFFGRDVYFRGIVEFSNVCENDCGYCGIRKHQSGVRRYTMPVSEVREVADWAFKNRMGTLMLQSGELETEKRMDYLLEMVRTVKDSTTKLDLEQRGEGYVPKPTDELGLCIALSVGELSERNYAALKEAGARRFLLRIETTNPDLYASLHPSAMSWHNRVECLQKLRSMGFQVMVGLPGQTMRDLAGDLRFFRELGANMIGMGPYITEPGTPVAEMWATTIGNDVDKGEHMKEMFELTTRMNALARITVGNANISATTALQAINPMGRELALQRGCNVLMPILTPTKYRENYMLYEGKPCITDTAEECRNCLNARVSMVGKRIRDGVWADPPNFLHPVVMPRPDAWATTIARAGDFAAMPHKRAGPASVAAARGFRTCAASARSAQPAPEASSNGVQPGGPVKGSDVPRLNIGVFGCMNAGKSTLLNSITRSDSSIVDSTPGTTADTKIVLMELHDIGPVKLFDTAGIDETGELGQKKRQKVLSVLKESDLVVVVVDAERTAQAGSLATALSWERLLYQKAVKQEAVPLLLINTKGCADNAAPDLRSRIVSTLTQPEAHTSAPAAEAAEPMVMELDLNSSHAPTAIADWLQEAAKRSKAAHNPRSLPEQYLSPEAMVFLNIPMDLETPSMRLLRPQALLQEEAIRHWAPTLAYRMDLAKARSDDPSLVAQERRRFDKALKPLLDHDGPKIMVTDSQAVDIVHPWTLDPETGEELVAFTTFSIAMIHRQSGGRLPLFTSGLRAFAQLQPGDRILVAEACHHNRITELCNDIGMVQIPQQVERHAGAGIGIDHAFGREFPDLEGGLDRFKLAVHCGGCMIDHQKIRARIMDLEEAGVPVTNYGLLLSYAHNPDALTRALAPWGVDPTF